MPFIGSVEGTFGYGRPVSQVVAFSYSNFQTTSGLALVSVATPTTPNYWMYLTTAINGDVGNVYRSSPILYNRSFTMQWNFECSGGNGADGFCLQWTTTNNTNGAGGGGVGYLSTAYQALLFLTHTNNVFNWYFNNTLQSSTPVSAGTFRQNLYYWADYNHSTSTMRVYYSTTTTKPASANFTLTGFSFNATPYYIGFGAATGGLNDNHILKSMTLTFT